MASTETVDGNANLEARILRLSSTLSLWKPDHEAAAAGDEKGEDEEEEEGGSIEGGIFEEGEA